MGLGYQYSHFTNEKAKCKEMLVKWPISHNNYMTESGFKLHLKMHVLTLRPYSLPRQFLLLSYPISSVQMNQPVRCLTSAGIRIEVTPAYTTSLLAMLIHSIHDSPEQCRKGFQQEPRFHVSQFHASHGQVSQIWATLQLMQCN